MGNNLITRPTILLEGRIISTTFHNNIENTINNDSNQILTIISIYNIPSSGKKLKNGKKRKDIRRKICNALNKHIIDVNRKYPNHSLIVQGNLQDTITTSNVDNSIPAKASKMAEDSVLSLITNEPFHLKSILFDQSKKGNDSYITRTPTVEHHNARGIDHVCTNQQAYDRFIGGCIDEITANMLISSDHYILHTEFSTNLILTEGQSKMIKKIQYGRVANIPLDNNFETVPTTPQFDKSLFQSKENKSSEALLEVITKYANDDTTNTNRLIEEAEHQIDELEKTLITASIDLSKNTSQEEDTYRRLIPRKNNYRTTIEQTLNLVMESIDEICIQAKLQKEVPDGAETPYTSNHLDTYLPESIKEFEQELSKDPIGLSLWKLMMVIKRTMHHAQNLHRILHTYTNSKKEKYSSHLLYKGTKLASYHMKSLTKMAKNSDGITLQQMIDGTNTKLNNQLKEWEDNIDAISTYRDVDPYGTSDNNKTGLLNCLSQDDINKIHNIIKNETGHQLGIKNIDPKIDMDDNTDTQQEGNEQKKNTWYHLDFTHIGLTPPTGTFYPDEDIIINIDWETTACVQSYTDSLTYTMSNIKHLLHQIYHQAKNYHNKRIQYAVLSNNLSLLSKVIILRGRDNPEPHNQIQDDDTKKWRPCKSVQERL